jgi:hypothetical protein
MSVTAVTLVHQGQACEGAPAPTETVAPEHYRATASSEWGPGYGATAAADGVADENGNYWQTVQGEGRGAWWQVDLRKIFDIEGVRIAWARYQDKYHCPPARMIIQTSLSGEEGSFTDVREIGIDELPGDGQAYDDARQWQYALPQPTRARCLRLLFPDGDQPEATYDGYLCLGEVEVLAPGLTPRVVTIEGPFGRADVNVTFPSLVHLYLRAPDGLDAQSLLAKRGRQ